jgi:hypothetical protein
MEKVCGLLMYVFECARPYSKSERHAPDLSANPLSFDLDRVDRRCDVLNKHHAQVRTRQLPPSSPPLSLARVTV